MPPARIGRYRIVGPIARGGMGEVYEGRDELLDRSVAIKCVRETEPGHSRRERLRREARAVAALSHPAIAQVHDIVVEDDADWIVMELVEGPSLDRLCIGRGMPAETVARIGEQIAGALAAAHSLGIVHRDVKTENVMLTHSGEVKVLDFGLATFAGLTGHDEGDRLTAEGVVVGTCRAMSPEQATARPVDPRSDVFSLGSLLYELLAGRPAFCGETPAEVMVRVAHAEHLPLLEAAPGTPPGLAAIVERCLERRPADRFQSAAEVAQALAAWRAGSVSAHPVTGSRTTRQPAAVRLPRVRTAAIAGALLVAALGGWLAWQRAHRTLHVALLPLQVAGDASSPLASAAITDAITAHLATLDGVEAISSQEVRGAAGADAPPTAIARAVGADELVQASLRVPAAAGPSRVTLSCIEGATGRVRWTHEVELDTRDPLVVEDGIRTALGDAFRGYAVVAGWRPDNASPAARSLYLQVRSALLEGRMSPGASEEIELLERAVADSPEFVAAVAQLLDLHRYAFERHDDAAERARCEELYRQAQRLDPNHPNVVASSLKLLLATGRADEAIATARAALARRPGDSSLWAQLGGAYSRAGDVEASEKALARALALRASWRTLVLVADARTSRNDYDGARTALLEATALAPDNLPVVAKLAFIELESGRYADADPLVRRLVAQRGLSTDHYNLGVVAFYLGRHDEAIGHYRRAAALAPTNPAPLVGEADAHLWSGGPDAARDCYARALALCEQALQASPEQPRLLRTKALCLAHLGRAVEAATTVQRALQLAPDSRESAFTAAVVSALAGEQASGVAWSLKARERGAPAAWFTGPEFERLRADPALRAALEPVR